MIINTSRSRSDAANNIFGYSNFVAVAAMGLLLTGTSSAATTTAAPQACWVETSAGNMPGGLGGAGLRETKIWHSTISSILVRDPNGDVLIDTGLGPNAAPQMSELPPAGKAFGLQVVGGAKGRKSLIAALAMVGESPARVKRIIITHAHYDHLGGATVLTAPIYVAAAEATWMASQAANPTFTPPSLIAAVKSRLHILSYDSGPYLGFAKSEDVFGDRTIVVVPLPGHTPGSQGMFIKIGDRRVFFIGDATDTLEAAERGLPKSAPIRGATDFEPKIADDTSKRIAAFHRSHPEIALIPAHDRVAYLAAFGHPAACVANFPSTIGANK
jgi:N-acyl homoserine lactone hydrolase